MKAQESGLIDAFIDKPDVAKSHEIRIDAPVEVVFDVAEHFDLQSIPTVRFLFRLREFLFLMRPKPRPQVKALVSETMKLGWVRLAHTPGRELIMGAVAQPWVGDVQFTSVSADPFASFAEPGYVKIVWTLEAEPLQRRSTLFRTQTRVLATDSAARKRFKLYWLFAGPLVSVIRILGIRAVRREAERRLI
jgi:hypothetical protein